MDDHRLGRSDSVMWKGGTSMVVARVCVSYGLMG
jgi:hypothetical protein